MSEMWSPTEYYLHGRIIKPFLPLDKHPNLNDEHFKNLYPGDEVYIFETKNDKWARGYSLTRPFPADIAIGSVNLDNLPGLRVKIVIFPLSYVKLVEKLPIKMNKTNVTTNCRFSNAVFETNIGDISSVADSSMTSHGNELSTLLEAGVPPLPFESFKFAGSLSDEIAYALNLLTSHIFELYSMGEFRLFNKLYDIYKRLDEMRVKLSHENLTRNEARITNETVTSLITSIPKNLASRAARVNAKSLDLESSLTDVSGYKAILARDSVDGTLSSLSLTLPSQLALNQELCALLPKYPINAQMNQDNYVVRPCLNRKLSHEQPSHILVDFNSVSGSSNHQPSGFAGMTAYLYIRNARKRLTEAFAVHTDSVEQLLFVEKISAAFFRNIPVAEVENNRVYLVAILTEEINLRPKDTKVPHIKGLKKGVAAGIADITKVFSRSENSLASGERHQFSIKLFGSYRSSKKSSNEVEPSRIENNGWGELVDRIIKNTNLGVAINTRAEKLVVYVKEFKHVRNDANNSLHKFLSAGTDGDDVSDLKGITRNAEPISKIWPIFFDSLAVDYERIYLKLGKISLLGSLGENKEMLTVVVSAPNNPTIRFAKASNQIPKPTWNFVSVFPGEVIGEILKVQGIHTSHHLLMIPAKNFLEFSLYSNGILIGDGKFAYKDNGVIVSSDGKSFHDVVICARQLRTPIAELQINSEYVGKAFNANPSIGIILSFSNYLTDDKESLRELLSALEVACSLDLATLLRFFPELMTALLAMTDVWLLHTEDVSLANLCFRCMVHILDTLFGRKDQYRYLFDRFLSTEVVNPGAGIFLLEKLALMFESSKKEWDSFCRSSCRILGFFVQLALSASKKVTSNLEFMSALTKLCDGASLFLANESPILVNDQILVLELPDFISQYEHDLDPHELVLLIVNFIDSVGTKGLSFDEQRPAGRRPVQATKDYSICVAKLLVIQRLYARDFIRDPKSAPLLVAKSVSWAMDIFIGPMVIETTRLAALIMNCVCDLVALLMEEEVMKNVCFSLVKHLGVLARTIIKYNKFLKGNDYFKPKKCFTNLFQNTYPFVEIVCDPVVGEESVVEVLIELGVIFVYVARIGKQAVGPQGLFAIHSNTIPGDFYDLPKLNSSNGLSEEVSTIIMGVQLIRQSHFFPQEKWLSLYAVFSEGCLLVLELLVPLMKIHFIPDMDHLELFDRALWGKFLRNLLKLGTLPPVSLEHLSTLPRKTCFQITSTVRDRITVILSEIWDALAWETSADDVQRFGLSRFGGYQVEFIGSEYGILPDLMLLALQRNSNCQKTSAKILWSIMVSEYIISDSIVEVEKECLIGLQSIFNRAAYKPAVNEQRLFISEIKSAVRLKAHDEAFPLVVKFARNISGFLDILNELNSVPAGAQFEDDRTFHKLKINAYLKEAGRPELFNSFVNQMYDDNVAKGDFVQAALSLELLMDTYTWEHLVVLPASFRPKFPEQTSFERKESLIRMIAHNYVKGNNLERATDTYNTLLEAYNEHTLDLKSFAYVHQKLAKLYLELESADKLSPSFFKISYMGMGFPVNIRNQEHIIQGSPFEHITAVHEKLLRRFPGAMIVLSEDQVVEVQKEPKSGRFIHVVSVEPMDEISDKILSTSLGERQYAKHKNLNKFSTIKKLPGATSVYDLWTEEVTYETKVTFPTLMNRSEIIKTSVLRLSPLENAIRGILNKITEISQLENLINAAYNQQADYSSLLNDLSMQLAGTVDSPVNGGVGQYRSFFLKPSYDGKADYAFNVRLLRSNFHDLAVILNRCLVLQGKLVAPSMRESHIALVELFKRNFKDEIGELKLKTDYDYSKYNHSVVASASSQMSNMEQNAESSSVLSSGAQSRGSSISDYPRNKRSALYWKIHGV